MHITPYDQKLIDRFHGIDWVAKLKPFTTTDTFKKLGKKINARRKLGVKIYPKQEDVFNVFKLNIKDIKVIVLGQDPYHNEHADGLAFSTKLGKWTPSLDKILKQVHTEYPSSFNESITGNLTPWLNQGVFLLNKVLTVEGNTARTHYGIGWEEFTSYVIKVISKERKNVVYLLWGKEAQEYAKYIDPVNNLILTAEHPAAACYDNRDWKNGRCFYKTNEYLIQNKIESIEW